MKNIILIAMLTLAAILVGTLVGRFWWPTAVSDTSPSAKVEREVLYYQAPMDPAYRRDKPGKSPMGMDLVPVYAEDANDDDSGVVAIDPTMINSLGVRTAIVEAGLMSRRIETVGYVSYDEDTVHQVSTRVDGWIEKLAVKASGDPVKRGQTLFELYSPTLVNAQEEFLAALKSHSTALHQASRERLAALGISASEIKRIEKERTLRRRVRVFAPADGVVAHLGVLEGKYITPATEVMSIARLDRVWVMAEVFERQAAWVELGQRAEVELEYLPGQRWQGTVDYIYPELDAKTRTLKVRLRFENNENVLRPNMFARVVIFDAGTRPMVHIPRQALIRGGTFNRVVVALGEGRFRSQPVDIGMESGGEVEIRSGLVAGDRVVTSGQFLIDSESNIDAALARMVGSSETTSISSATTMATIRAIDITGRRITIHHEPIEDWAQPEMIMTVEVSDVSLLHDLGIGQQIIVTIERQANGSHLVTAIRPSEVTDSAESEEPPKVNATEHDQHEKEAAQ